MSLVLNMVGGGGVGKNWGELKELIPQMTSNNTTSEGVICGVVSSSSYSTYPPWYAFDRQTSLQRSWTASSSSLPQWIQYRFPENKKIAYFTFLNVSDGSYSKPTNLIVSISKDGDNFTEIKQFNDVAAGSTQQLFFDEEYECIAIRWSILNRNNTYDTNNGVRVGELQVYGREVIKDKNWGTCINPIWSSTSDPISYTYTATQSGQFLVAFIRGDGGGSMTSTGKITTILNPTNSRELGLYLVDCNVGNTISLSISNYSGGAYRGNNAFIGLLSNPIEYYGGFISEYKTDGTITKSATFAKDTKYLIIQMSCGTERTSSRTIGYPKLISDYSTDSIYIAIIYGQNTSASFSQKGNTAGGAWIYSCILK